MSIKMQELVRIAKKNYLPLTGVAVIVWIVISSKHSTNSNSFIEIGRPAFKHQIYHNKYNIHIFYQANYRNLQNDGYFNGWNKTNVDVQESIASNYYPLRGLYSSKDSKIVEVHMKEIKEMGVGVVVVSWWPKYDKNAPHLPTVFEIAQKYNLKVTIQVQDYEGRTVNNLREHLKDFFRLYCHHPAMYRITFRNKSLPLLYIYNSYLIPWQEWYPMLRDNKPPSVRGTKLDAVFIGHIAEVEDELHIEQSGFNGFYSYFAVNKLTYSSTWTMWPYLNDLAKAQSKIFIPTVAPGYINTWADPDRPQANRKNGNYYSSAWTRAVYSRSKFVSINSYNNWQEGTQIEPAAECNEQIKQRCLDYSPDDSSFYIFLTTNNVKKFLEALFRRQV